MSQAVTVMMTLLLLAAAAVPAMAGVLEGTMARGNGLYESGDYRNAVAEYEKVLRYGLSNSAVHYNLGNAWFKLDRSGPAILHYERALRLDPGNADAAVNLAFARGRIIDRVVDEQQNIYLRLLQGFRDAFTPDQAAFTFLVTWLILSAAIFVRIMGNGSGRKSARSRLIFYTALCAFLIMAAASLQYGLRWRHLSSTDQAIVMTERVDVVSAPGADAKLVTPVHEGLKVRIVEEREGWLRIIIPGAGLGGWVPAAPVERI